MVINMNSEFLIRKAEAVDKQTLVEFNYNMALETEKRKLNLDLLDKGVDNMLNDSDKGFYLVCEHDKEGIVASLMITKEWSDWRNKNFWWIQSVYVIKEFRRKGLFKKLYEHVNAIGEENGNCCGFRLYVEKENFIAQRTYLSMGMKEAYYQMYEVDFCE